MKKFERIDDRLFAPLAEDEQRRAKGAAVTAHISALETNNPNPDEVFDYG